jgi:hypothetical protein
VTGQCSVTIINTGIQHNIIRNILAAKKLKISVFLNKNTQNNKLCLQQMEKYFKNTDYETIKQIFPALDNCNYSYLNAIF